MFKADPGQCPICGAAHTTCTAGGRSTSIVVVQLPARDAVAEFNPPRLVAEVVHETLPDGQFTTATYRSQKKARG